jgi:hypothetical protein
MDQQNSNFYKYIVNLTRTSRPASCKKILEQDSDIITSLILGNYRENIERVAADGRNCAYLCVYAKDAKYKGMVPVHGLVEMPEKISQKFTEFELIPVMTRVCKELEPFVVSVRELKQCTELPVDQPVDREIMVISVSWNAETINP